MTPNYQLPSDPGQPGAADFRSTLIALGAFALANVVSTQRLAWIFHQQLPLGPGFALGPYVLYPPWDWLVWTIKFIGFTPAARPTLIVNAVAMFGVSLACLVLRLVLISVRRRRAGGLKNDLHGSARWATQKDLVAAGKLNQSTGPFIGGWEDTPGHITYLRDPSDGHCLAFAPTGSGKGAGLVVPTLLANEEYSMIVLDPKQQLHSLTSGYRSQAGNQVFSFRPAAEHSSRFNPLAEVRLFTHHDFQDASNIAHMLCHVPGEASTDAHWDTIAEQLIAGLVLHERYKLLQHGRVATLLDIAEAVAELEISFDKLAEMTAFPHDPTGEMGWHLPTGEPTATNPAVRAAANAMLGRISDGEPNREYQATISNAQKRLNVFRDPMVQNATSSSDFSIEDLVNHERPVTLYLSVPIGDDTQRLKPITRLVISMIFSRLTEPQRLDKSNRHRLLWMMDEFPTLGFMRVFTTGLPVARDFGMKFFLIAQSIGQIEAAFPREHGALVNNCDCWSAYAPNDWDTRSMLSRQSGKRTVAHRVQSYTGKNYGSTKNGVTESISYSERELITPDEVARLKVPRKEGTETHNRIVEPGEMLIFVLGFPPIFGRQMLYFFDPVFRERAAIPPVEKWPALARRAAA